MPDASIEAQLFQTLSQSYQVTLKPLPVVAGGVPGSDGYVLGRAIRRLWSRAFPMMSAFLQHNGTLLPAPFRSGDRLSPAQMVALAREWLPRAGMGNVVEERLGSVNRLRAMANKLLSTDQRRAFFLLICWGGGASEDVVQRVEVMAFDVYEHWLHDGRVGEAECYQGIELATFYWAWIQRKAMPEANANSVLFGMDRGATHHFV